MGTASLRTAEAFSVVASLPPKIASERSDDRKCVCCGYPMPPTGNLTLTHEGTNKQRKTGRIYHYTITVEGNALAPGVNYDDLQYVIEKFQFHRHPANSVG